jgi:iron complex outermembrane receptor protein
LNTKSTRRRLLGTSVLAAAALAIAAPAGVSLAQTAQTAQPATTPPVEEVVVTGSILRKPLSATPDPVTTVTATELDNRGITTIANAVQQLSAGGSSALPNSFTGNGAFAAGAAAVSLRGLTSNSTLVLVDGLRMTYYPLSDDGTRAFVDLNTIPDIIIDRIQVDKDGASATYGADAIAGVVNIITKKTYQGGLLTAEGGWTQQGGGGETRVAGLFGKGDLGADGYNFYIGVEYEHDQALYSRDRGYPYDTSNQSSTCGASLQGGTTCRFNNVIGGLQADGSLLAGLGPNGDIIGNTGVAVVLPYASNSATAPVAGAAFQLLNPAAGCGKLNPTTITPAQAAAGGFTFGFPNNVTLCQQDNQKLFGLISPDDKRYSINVHGTKKLWGDAEGYFTVNYYHNDVLAIGGYGSPSNIRNVSTPGANGLSYSTVGTPGVTLPVYVCPQGSATYVCTGTETGAKLNPNNPFASLGEVAAIFYSFNDIPVSTEYLNNTYHIETGFHGSFNWMGPWNYAVDATGSQTDLQVVSKGDLYIGNLLTAINQGSYNFADPSSNTASIRNFIAPTNVQNTSSNLAMVQGTLTRDLFKLPGGPVQVGVIGALRYESLYDPSANPDSNGTYARYFTLNPFGVISERSTEGVGYEIDLPFIDQIDVKTSGRYDNYSTGQSHFSPKVGGIIHPFRDWAPQFDLFALRATFSQGFRIPSFAESDELPTTGFTPGQVPPPSFQAAHGGDQYSQSFTLGLTTIGTPGLKPETSNNFTGGIVFEPTKTISLSLDFYRIEKKNVIVPNQNAVNAALAAYFAGQPLPAGTAIVKGPADPLYPNALPLPFAVEYGFINQNQETTSGYDIGGQVRYNLPYGVKFTSSFDGNYILRLNMITPTGTEHFAGSIGPYFNVSGAGTPKFKANWSNTFAKGPFAFTLTAYFTDGYDLQAEDYGDTVGLCISNGDSASNINTKYADNVTPVRCKVKSFWDIQTHLSYDFTSKLQFYIDVDNLFDRSAPYDPTTYGGFDYNDVVANSGIYGRTFKVGVRAKF